MEEESLIRISDRLSRNRRSGRWFGADLHVHTKDSHDVSSTASENAEEFIKAFFDAGIAIVAVTDHSTGEYVDKAIEAAASLMESSEAQVLVLPGVELTVDPGVHLVAILPTGGTAAVEDLLSVLGVPLESRGRSTTVVAKSVVEVADAVHEKNGLVIAAHCNSTNGLVEVLNGQSRRMALAAIDALEYKTATAELA